MKTMIIDTTTDEENNADRNNDDNPKHIHAYGVKTAPVVIACDCHFHIHDGCTCTHGSCYVLTFSCCTCTHGGWGGWDDNVRCTCTHG